jgi:hypothetical protein
MKLHIIFFIIIFVIIDGIQNAPVIHPIHVQTIPLHPVTAKPTVITSQFTQSSEKYSSDITQSTELTSSPSLSSTTPHHSSWWNDSNSTGQRIFRIFIYICAFTLVCKFLECVGKSKKQETPSKKKCPVVVENKMYISTIDGQREEPPPAYVEIHKI